MLALPSGSSSPAAASGAVAAAAEAAPGVGAMAGMQLRAVDVCGPAAALHPLEVERLMQLQQLQATAATASHQLSALQAIHVLQAEVDRAQRDEAEATAALTAVNNNLSALMALLQPGALQPVAGAGAAGLGMTADSSASSMLRSGSFHAGASLTAQTGLVSAGMPALGSNPQSRQASDELLLVPVFEGQQQPGPAAASSQGLHSVGTGGSWSQQCVGATTAGMAATTVSAGLAAAGSYGGLHVLILSEGLAVQPVSSNGLLPGSTGSAMLPLPGQQYTYIG